MKPIVIEKRGSGYYIRVRVPTERGGTILDPDGGDYVVRSTGPAGSSMPGRSVYKVGGKPMLFKTKSDARHIAHQIGRYALHMGDLAFAYVEGW